MSDKVIVYSLVKKSDIVFTKFKIEPNTITLFNNIIITPILLYNIYYDFYIVSLMLVWIRAYLDGLDGYIARKFDKCSKLGEIYDHFSDCLYGGALTTILMNKVSILKPYSASIGYMFSIFEVICDYDERFYHIAKFAGAGGNEDGYSFLIPFSFVSLMYILHLIEYINII